MQENGFTSIYDPIVNRFECDYPPLYLYILNFWGWLFTFFNLPISSHFFDTCLKTCTLLSEISFFYWLYNRKSNPYFLVLMAISPVTILNAYGWGQIDLLYSMLLIAACIYLFEQKLIAFAILIALSVNLKTQTLLYFPLLAIYFFQKNTSYKLQFRAFIVFVIAFLIPNIPFLLNENHVFASIEPHFTAGGRYNFISVNAFNGWWAAFADFNLKQNLLFPPNDVSLIFSLSRKTVALILFSGCYSIILFTSLKRSLNNAQKIALLAYLSFSFFMLLPEMHERYLFPFFMFSAWLVLYSKNELSYFLIIAILHAINLLWGWGEQKYFLEKWMFETTRVVALVTFIVWLFYTRSLIKNFNQLKT